MLQQIFPAARSTAEDITQARGRLFKTGNAKDVS